MIASRYPIQFLRSTLLRTFKLNLSHAFTMLFSCGKRNMTLVDHHPVELSPTRTSTAHCKKPSLEAASADTSTTLGQLSRASGRCLQSRPASIQRVTSCRFSSAYGATTIVTPEPDSIAGVHRGSWCQPLSQVLLHLPWMMTRIRCHPRCQLLRHHPF